jgi:hypothetical protein
MTAAAVPLAVEGRSHRAYRGAAVLALLVIAFQFPPNCTWHATTPWSWSPLILIMTQLAHPAGVTSLIVDRGLETLIGACIGSAAALFPQRSAQTAPVHGTAAPRRGLTQRGQKEGDMASQPCPPPAGEAVSP